MVGLALAGGGAKGAYQVGAYLALINNGIKPEVIAGTSIGSVNAVLMAQGDINNLVSLWLNTNLDIFGLDLKLTKKIKSKDFTFDDLKSDFGQVLKIFQNKGIDSSKFLEALKKSINEDKLRQSKVKFGLITVKYKNKKFIPLELTIDDIPEGKVCEYVLASCYWPLFSYKKIIDDEYYLDGGFYNNTPVSLVEKSGCNIIYAIKIKGVGLERNKLNTNTKVIEISPSKSLGSMLFIDKDKSSRNMRMGYLDTLKALKRIVGYNYYFFSKRENYFNKIVKKIDKKTIDKLHSKFKTDSNKDLVLKSIEYLMIKNDFYDLEIYKIKKVIKILKNDNKYLKSKLLNDFIKNIKERGFIYG